MRVLAGGECASVALFQTTSSRSYVIDVQGLGPIAHGDDVNFLAPAVSIVSVLQLLFARMYVHAHLMARWREDSPLLHFTSPSYGLESISDNRVYLSCDQADNFVRCFLRFAHGKVVVDEG